MEQARIGVIGTGWWATDRHIPSLLEYEPARVAMLCDRDPERLAAASAHFDIQRTTTDYHELLASGEVDGVIVAVQHAYHYQIARDALDAGVHVFVEKPMTLTARDGWDLVERARARGLHLTVGYTYHYTEQAARLREAVQGGAIGELALVSVLFSSAVSAYYRGAPQEWRESFAWRLTGPSASTYSDPKIAGGGQGQTQITHPMGMVFWVTGERASEVHAYMNAMGAEVDIVDAVSYRLEGGAIGTVASTGSLQPGNKPQQELRYYGSEGYAIQDLHMGVAQIHRYDGSVESFDAHTGSETYLWEKPARAFADLILGGTENRAPGEVGATTAEFLEAAYRSAGSGKAVRIEELD